MRISWLSVVLLGAAAHAETSKPVDVCRIDDVNHLLTCQHYKNGKALPMTKVPPKAVDRWMAIPCKQLKRYYPRVNCKPVLFEMRFGEQLPKKNDQ